MVEYCQEDVSICGELYHYLTRELKGFSEQSISLEHKVAAIVARQEKHGFKLDTVKSQCLLGQWKRRLSDIEENLQSVFPPIVTERISEKTGKKLKIHQQSIVVLFNYKDRWTLWKLHGERFVCYTKAQS